nr:MAG TPA_asm: hypothetical protein [Caudoviricetes sp.]
MEHKGGEVICVDTGLSSAVLSGSGIGCTFRMQPAVVATGPDVVCQKPPGL